MPRQTTIAIVDNHQLFAEGLAAILKTEDNLSVCCICLNVAAIYSYLEDNQPDIVLLDINLGHVTDGLEVCLKIKADYPNIKVMVVSAHSDFLHISEMKKAGAVGYVFKNISREGILEAINAVINGETFFRGQVEKILHLDYVKPDDYIDLNPKESKILRAVLKGKTTREIADEMRMSVKTIEFYRGTLFVKFGVRNVVELVNKSNLYFQTERYG